MLWPLLLAPFASLSGGDLFPLLINLIAGVATLRVFTLIVASVLGTNGSADRTRSAVLLIPLLLIPATNLVGLVFTGMEHSLQVFFAAVLVLGLTREARENRAPWWLSAAIVIGPLLRYESLALSAGALLYLLRRGRIGSAVISGLVLAAALGGFSLFLASHELGFIPTSILVKSSAVRQSASPDALLGTLRHNLSGSQGLFLLLALALILWRSLDRERPFAERALGHSMVLAGILHLGIGQFGWLSRYEIYMWTAIALTLIVLFRDRLRALLDRGQRGRLALSLGVMAVSVPYVYAGVFAPWYANEMYQQQYQMNRFVTEFYDAPVAVNDLGWVSYRNDRYVLDLWGLAAKRALEARRLSESADWMDEFARKGEVELAMVYWSWFREFPANWVRLGAMHLDRKRPGSGREPVTFYATSATAGRRILPIIERFAPTLPTGAEFILASEE
jgi:hypothetical protein